MPAPRQPDVGPRGSPLPPAPLGGRYVSGADDHDPLLSNEALVPIEAGGHPSGAGHRVGRSAPDARAWRRASGLRMTALRMICTVPLWWRASAPTVANAKTDGDDVPDSGACQIEIDGSAGSARVCGSVLTIRRMLNGSGDSTWLASLGCGLPRGLVRLGIVAALVHHRDPRGSGSSCCRDLTLRERGTFPFGFGRTYGVR